MTTVSVVTPTFNAAKYLERAIASAQTQVPAVREIIVVDDGSTDGSPDLARALGVTVLCTGKNAGPSAARNLGIRGAHGDLVAFLDADDFWEPDHCAGLVALLNRFPEACLAFSRVRFFGARSGLSDTPVPSGQPADAFWLCVRRNIAYQSAVIARREALLAAGGYDERMRWGEDYDLWLRLTRRQPVVCTQAVTTNYRIHSDQASRRYLALVEGSFFARHKLLEALPASDRAIATALSVEIRSHWSDFLREAWRSRDVDTMEFALSLASLVPDSDASAARWRARFRRYWPAWVVLGGAWDRIRPEVKGRLRAPLRRLLGLR